MSTGWCTVSGCPGRQHDVYFKFPEDEDLCEEWLRLVKSPKSKKPILHLLSSRVCSLHFSDDDFDKKVEPGGLTLERLKLTAIPSIFPWTESWPLNKKKKKATSVNEKKPSESQKKTDATADQTFGYRSTTEGGASAVPKRRSARPKALTTESGSSHSSTDWNSLESNDFSSTNISGSESVGGSRSSSIDSGIHKSTTSMFSKASGTPPGDAIDFNAALKGMKLDHSYAVKREKDTTPIVLDIGSSSDEEKEDEVIQSSETVVKKENKAGEGQGKERKIICVVSGDADD